MSERESKLIFLMSGRKLSDRATRAALGCTQNELLALGETVRAKLNLASGADIRSFLRSGN